MKLILVGYMGSGKTLIGKSLSNKLNYSFKDLDDFVEEKEQMSISEIFKNKGEIYFRKKELESLNELLQKDEDFVLSLGGGTPCYGNAMQTMLDAKKATTVYLKTSLEELTGRLFSEKGKRPLIAHLSSEEELKDFIRKHLFERAPIYEQSEIIVSTNGRTEKEITDEILKRLF